MASKESLFFSASFRKYKEGKINLLAAKSGILKCRERLKELEKGMTGEELAEKKIKKGISEVRAAIKELNSYLPAVKEEVKKKVIKEEAIAKKVEAKKTEKDKIMDEIEDINQKIRELENL